MAVNHDADVQNVVIVVLHPLATLLVMTLTLRWAISNEYRLDKYVRCGVVWCGVVTFE